MRLATLGFAFLLTACGGKDAAPPLAPTPVAPAAPTVTGLSIIGLRALRTGQSETMRAEAVLSSGVTQPATNSTWSSSNASVATVSEGGVVTALAHGSANINVSAGGASAQLPIQVWQDYQGTWTGSYLINVCTETGAFRGFCREFPRGTELPFRLILTQTSDSANGTVLLGSLSGSIRGGIFDSRRFIGAGTLSTVIEGVPFNANIGTFSVLSTSNSLAGNLVITITADGISGNTYWEAVLGPVTRSLTPVALDTREFDAKVRSILR